MAKQFKTGPGNDDPLEVLAPEQQSAPVIFASPHSGTDYPSDFVANSPLDLTALRRSEDSFVDELFAAAPEHGMPLLRALFPRAYIDPNREPFELDPGMFEDALPDYANAQSSRVHAGLGTIAKLVSSGHEIYGKKLRFAEAAERINTNYRPYHRELRDLLDQTRQDFGCYLLIDCHSMPSVGGPHDPDAGRRRADIVLGDCFASACNEAVISTVEAVFAARGYQVSRNKPFAGGFSTRHYGHPQQGRHALQIEINRALYMDEASIKQNDGMAKMTNDITAVINTLSEIDYNDLLPD
ncbi:MAG: N-formylglutamate amidohydrolase [Alphaproteobacteria bacterium]|nr:N-formylglutamate amidohydrolase [Alphaproteobacteria bacterium]